MDPFHPYASLFSSDSEEGALYKLPYMFKLAINPASLSGDIAYDLHQRVSLSRVSLLTRRLRKLDYMWRYDALVLLSAIALTASTRKQHSPKCRNTKTNKIACMKNSPSAPQSNYSATLSAQMHFANKKPNPAPYQPSAPSPYGPKHGAGASRAVAQNSPPSSR